MQTPLLWQELMSQQLWVQRVKIASDFYRSPDCVHFCPVSLATLQIWNIRTNAQEGSTIIPKQSSVVKHARFPRLPLEYQTAFVFPILWIHGNITVIEIHHIIGMQARPKEFCFQTKISLMCGGMPFFSWPHIISPFPLWTQTVAFKNPATIAEENKAKFGRGWFRHNWILEKTCPCECPWLLWPCLDSRVASIIWGLAWLHS